MPGSGRSTPTRRWSDIGACAWGSLLGLGRWWPDYHGSRSSSFRRLATLARGVVTEHQGTGGECMALRESLTTGKPDSVDVSRRGTRRGGLQGGDSNDRYPSMFLGRLR